MRSIQIVPPPPGARGRRPSASLDPRRLALVRRLVAAALFGLLAACAEGGERAPGADVLLITVDTLRADALGCYGGPAADTPAIDAVAREALVFDRARAPIPITTPSLASILTGRLPRNHGALGNSFDLGIDGDRLAESLAAAGYSCAAFLPSFLADKDGFRPGFEHYAFPPLGSPTRTARELAAEALAWIEARPADAGPWFVWIHVLEPHAPYAAPRELEQRTMAEAGLAGRSVPPSLREPRAHPSGELPDEARAILGAIYRAEVIETDAALAPLLALGRERERPLLTVFTADHGEMLGERHGYVGHTGWLYEEMLRVPLVLHLSDRDLGGRRVPFDASLHDLPTTIAATVGVEWRARDRSVDLFRAASDPPRRVGVFETFAPEGHHDQQAVLVDGLKLHRPVLDGPGWPRAGRPAFPRLYDLTDGREQQDLAPGSPKAVEGIERLFAVWRETQTDPAQWPRPKVGSDERRALEALGYLQEQPEATSADPIEGSDR